MRVVATYSIKGGVGKTSTAVNLAYLAAESGARTLLWDLDPQGAATFCFRIKPKLRGGGKKLFRGERPVERHVRGTDFEGLHLLPADFSLRHLDLVLDGTPRGTTRLAERVRPLAQAYDWVFLDCAPSISRVSEAVFAASDALLVPTVPTVLSVRMLARLVKHLTKKEVGVLVLPFFCMVDSRKALHRELCEARNGTVPGLLHSRIPYASLVEQMAVKRAPLAAFARTSPAARAFAELWREVSERVSPRS